MSLMSWENETGVKFTAGVGLEPVGHRAQQGRPAVAVLCRFKNAWLASFFSLAARYALPSWRGFPHSAAGGGAEKPIFRVTGLQGHLSHAAAYGEAVAGSGRPAGSGPSAGAGEGLPKVFPASSPREVGYQFQEFLWQPRCLLRKIVNFVNVCSDGDLVCRGRTGTVERAGMTEIFLARDHIR